MLFLKFFVVAGCFLIIKPGGNSAMRIPTDPTTSTTTTKKGGKPPPKTKPPKITTVQTTTPGMVFDWAVPFNTEPATTTVGFDWAVPFNTEPATTTVGFDWAVPFNTEPATTTVGFDWAVPFNTEPVTTTTPGMDADMVPPTVTEPVTTTTPGMDADMVPPTVTEPVTTTTPGMDADMVPPTVTEPVTTTTPGMDADMVPPTVTEPVTTTTPGMDADMVPPTVTEPVTTTTPGMDADMVPPTVTEPVTTTTPGMDADMVPPTVTEPVTTTTPGMDADMVPPTVTEPVTTTTPGMDADMVPPTVTEPVTTTTPGMDADMVPPTVTEPATTTTLGMDADMVPPTVTEPATTTTLGMVNESPELSTTDAPVTTTEPKPISDIYYMKQLFKDFIKNTDPKIRPVINQSAPIHVHTNFVPISVVHFDMSEQRFAILAYFRVGWTDELIKWKPRLYNRLYYMKVPTTDIWTPKLIIQKPYDGDGEIGEVTDITVISFKGKVQWVPDGTYSFVCDVNIQYYPFDEQVCTISYYMADETYNTLELTHDAEVDMSELTENSAWKILKLTVKNYIEKDVYYVDVNFHLQRRPNFTTFTLIMPLLMLAFLNVCIFLVPADSGEKGGFAITIFLSYGIFISILSDTLPNNSIQTSYFVIFITVLLGLSVISVFYVIVQAKVIYCMGVKESLIKCFIPEYMKGKEKVDGAQRSMDQFVNDSTPALKNSDAATAWKLIFHKIDMVLFFTFLVIALIATTAFFCIMLRRITESEFNI